MTQEILGIDVELAFGTEFVHSDTNVYCPYHDEEEGVSKSKSCSVNIGGFFNCHVCSAKGTAVDFYAYVHKIDKDEAREQLKESQTKAKTRKFRELKSPRRTGTLNPSLGSLCHKELFTLYEHKLAYLYEERGLTESIVDIFQIGHDEHRYTIPVYDEAEKLVNIRRYLPNADGHAKMVSHNNGDGTPILWPLDYLKDLKDGIELILCEGEWDCMLLHKHGFEAVTTTGGVKKWCKEWSEHLQRFNIVIIYDVHDKDNLGQNYAKERAEIFNCLGTSVKVVKLPLPEIYRGGDITDYFMKENHTKEELQKLIDDTPKYSSDNNDGAVAVGLNYLPPIKHATVADIPVIEV